MFGDFSCLYVVINIIELYESLFALSAFSSVAPLYGYSPLPFGVIIRVFIVSVSWPVCREGQFHEHYKSVIQSDYAVSQGLDLFSQFLRSKLCRE